jgi:hypothetical protein
MKMKADLLQDLSVFTERYEKRKARRPHAIFSCATL